MLSLLVTHEVEVDIYDLYDAIGNDSDQVDFLKDKMEELDQESFFDVVNRVIDNTISDQVMEQQMEDRFDWLDEQRQEELLDYIVGSLSKERIERVLEVNGYSVKIEGEEQ